MLKLNTPTRGSQASKLPLTTTLGVSWLNGAFSALPLHRGTLGTGWTSPTPVNTAQELVAALREAVTRTGFEGTHVSVLIGHARLAYHWVEVPAGRNTQLQKYLQRQAQQHKPFEGAAVWAWQPTFTTKTSGGALLHLLPRSVHDELVRACEEAGLHLATLIPVGEAVRLRLAQLPLRNDEIALLAADTGASTVVSVSQADGTPLLARTINESWGGDLNRVAVDLNRTLLFAQQQFGKAIGSVWLLGPDAERVATVMQGFFEAPVKAAPRAEAAHVWAEEALRLSADPAINLVTREQKSAPTRRILLRISTVAAVAMMILSLAIAWYVHRQYQTEIAAIAKLRAIEQDLQKRHREMQRVHEEIARQERFVTEAGEHRADPVAAWFLGYLSEAVPDDLLVTNVVVRAATNHWRISLSGTPQPAAVAAARADMVKLTRQFTNQLAQGPFAVNCSADLPAENESIKVTGFTTAYAVWAQKMKNMTAGTTLEMQRFQVEGVMR